MIRRDQPALVPATDRLPVCAAGGGSGGVAVEAVRTAAGPVPEAAARPRGRGLGFLRAFRAIFRQNPDDAGDADRATD